MDAPDSVYQREEGLTARVSAGPPPSRLGQVDRQAASLDRLLVKRVDRGPRTRFVSHFDEREPVCAAGLPFPDDFNAFDRPCLRELGHRTRPRSTSPIAVGHRNPCSLARE
jgi:hypothetical protein